ncbi:MAG: tetratricopeptide repeat protein [Acidobacteriia bacterium]|nr:tetratricopeptide repeat protein [Terriglobia bacterium]
MNRNRRLYRRAASILITVAMGLFSLPLLWSQSPPDYPAAAAYVRQGRADLAIPMLEQILATSPNDLKARNLLGIALLNAGRKEEAGVQFRKALQTDPSFIPALKNLAVNEMALGQKGEAKAHFERLLKLVPNDPVAHLYMGEICFAGHGYPQAVAHYNQSGGMHLRDPQATVHFATSAVESNQVAAAELALNRLPPDAAQFQFDAGLLLAGAKRYEAASHHFLLAQKNFPDPYQVGFNLTLVYVEGHNYPAAIETGEKLARDFQKAELYNLLSRAYEAGGRTQDAYDALRTATRIDPQDETNYLDLMSLCLTHENWDLSLEISDVAVSRIPQAYRVRLQRGAVLAMKGRLEDAESEFLAAAGLAPQSSLPIVALAVVRIEMKKPEPAVTALRTRRKQNPEDYLVDWFLAEALSQVGVEPGTATEKEAMEALEDAVRSNPAAAQPRVLLGKLLVKRGEPERATRQFEEALKLEPNDITAAYQLALLDRKAGNTKRAEELMTKVGKATSAPDAGQRTRRELVKIVREGSR